MLKHPVQTRWWSIWVLMWMVLAGCGDHRAENLLQKANDEWVKGRHHSAIELFNAVLELTPQGPQAEESLYRLGEIYYFSLGETGKAISYFQEVVRMKPPGEFAYGAQKYIAEIVELNFRDLDQAIIEYQKLIHNYKRPDANPEHQFRIASIYFKKHNYEQAIVEFETLVENYPRNIWSEEAYLRMAEILHNIHRCPEAREKYSQFRVVYPGSEFTGQMEFVMASCLEDEGKLKLAYNRFKSLEGGFKYPALLKMKLEGIQNRIKKGGKSRR
ncbi:MAG: tetratricopeptide repeat protein, partial [Nitrospinaceae bacterium]|nr:tetratricopeptide repeat protein [Nitrospinaceae bacterium]NIR53968.1 tetratricopeptide repeat protein [Nitrospinaceae bacterium]NIS84382.1 tetratricopeptide repeat protein [Nitrospinaceae bacterium]NIT81188.1 tetratricopeptide repeat protein [Nitrospinaceae bacterium]NIU43467.1 tetratricopeptide repeat protein [Nitrospinaceae bacterium]